MIDPEGHPRFEVLGKRAALTDLPLSLAVVAVDPAHSRHQIDFALRRFRMVALPVELSDSKPASRADFHWPAIGDRVHLQAPPRERTLDQF